MELFHEGAQMTIDKHTGWFTCDDAQKKQWVDDELIKEWLVVDCRKHSRTPL